MKAGTRYVLLGGLVILALGLVAGGVAFLRGGLPAFAGATSSPEAYSSRGQG